MRKLLRRKKQGGFVVGTELIFLISCILCVAVIAWGSVGAKIVAEWGDIGSAIGSLNQSYTLSGMAVFHPNHVHNANNPLASWGGSSFTDSGDFCDQGCECGIVLCISGSETNYKSCT